MSFNNITEFEDLKNRFKSLDDKALAILVLAQAVGNCAYELKYLTFGDAYNVNKMGAIEGLTMSIRDGFDKLSESISESISESTSEEDL
jgi:hypothetical protein